MLNSLEGALVKLLQREDAAGVVARSEILAALGNGIAQIISDMRKGCQTLALY